MIGHRKTPGGTPAIAMPANDPAHGPTVERQPRILIVDDQEAVVQTLRRVLARGGYHDVVSTNDPRTAVELFRSVLPDLVLLDLHMPHIDGSAVLKLLTAEIPPESYVPILMLTADATADVKHRALSAGAKDFLAKPFDHSEALLRIRNLLETRSLHLLLGDRNATLETRVEQRTQDVHHAHLETLHRLARTAECRDDDTGEHTRRVGELAAALAERCGCSEETVTAIRHTAALHDIGKVGIPDHVLLKPGPLTTAEMDIMKTHTALGAEILAGGDSVFMQTAERIAASHHERWDGTGYPRGLSGDSIPLEARIVAVADVFDALSHGRPYRLAWTIDAVLAELTAQRNRQFDPAVVDAFLDLHQSLATHGGGLLR
jgi:putative two-component system response regulator